VGKDVTAFCGQIDEDMVGQKVVVAGIVAEARILVTNDRRQFASVAVEDLEGSLEVTVWPEVFERTKELWKEGEVVLIRGKVTNRRGVIQLTCDHVQAYDPIISDDGEPGPTPQHPAPRNAAAYTNQSDSLVPDEAEPDWSNNLDEEPAPAVVAVSAVAPASPALAAAAVASPPFASAMHAQPPVRVAPQTAMVKPVPAQRHAVATGAMKGGDGPATGGNGSAAPKQPRGLSIHMHETNDPDRDLEKLNAVIDVLGRHTGPAPVSLTVFSAGAAVPLDLPGIKVEVCQRLIEELGQIVGPGAVIAEAAAVGAAG
jgi:hypothetical protein